MSSTAPLPPSGRDPAAARRRRDLWILAGLFALMLAGLAALAAATGWRQTLQSFASLGLGQVALLLLLSLVNYALRGLRWHLFANRLGLATGLMQDLRHFIGGFAMSATPGRVGELVRMRWIERETGWAFERTAPLVLIDRASDLTAMAVLLALALGFSAGGIAGALPVIALALAVAYVATHPALLSRAAGYGYRITGAFKRLFVGVRRASVSLAHFRSPAVLMIAGALGLAGWMAEGVAFHLLLVWMGADVGLWSAVAIFVFSTLAGGLTGAPGGVGGAEAVMIGLLTAQGVPLETSIPATLIIRVTTLWFAIGLGLVVFPIAERLSLKAFHAHKTR
ncbi:MAG: flippase-like domain-containing protein [Rhodobacteraceae bacterium]|nr:flippase-like domain-containing protein [Paracoccaceae bacterium]